MTKRGRAQLRAVVYRATLPSRRHNQRLKAHYERLTQRVTHLLPPVQAIGACMKCSVELNPMLHRIRDSLTCPAMTEPDLETSGPFVLLTAREPSGHIDHRWASSSNA